MALVITQSGSKKTGSTNYSLKCDIPSFNDQAVWSRDGIHMSACLNDICFTRRNGPYAFDYDASGIYVYFDTLSALENGIIWKCEHAGYDSVQFTVEVEDAEEEAAGLAGDAEEEAAGLAGDAEKIAAGLAGDGKLGIFAGVAVVAGIGIGLLFKYLAHRGDEKVCYVNEGDAISLPLPDMRTHSWKQDPNSKTIEIPKVKVDDEALYDCTYGTKTLKYRLVVVGTEEKVKTQVGKSVVFGKHIADGDAKTGVEWTKNGAIVKLNHPEPTMVKINEVSATDGGKYVCTFGPSKMKLTYNLVIIDRFEML